MTILEKYVKTLVSGKEKELLRTIFLLENRIRPMLMRYSGGQNKVGQVLLRNLAKIEFCKPG
jgi:hypothetical protein